MSKIKELDTSDTGIEGVKIKKLKVIPDYRGRLMEMLRCDDEIFAKFGQAYMSSIKPGIVKAWHYHKKQTDNVVCVYGGIKLVIFDDRENSKSKGKIKEIIVNPDEPVLVQIPPFIWHGWENTGEHESIVINIPDLPYNREEPDEFRKDPFNSEIPYKWDAKKGG